MSNYLLRKNSAILRLDVILCENRWKPWDLILRHCFLTKTSWKRHSIESASCFQATSRLSVQAPICRLICSQQGVPNSYRTTADKRSAKRCTIFEKREQDGSIPQCRSRTRCRPFRWLLRIPFTRLTILRLHPHRRKPISIIDGYSPAADEIEPVADNFLKGGGSYPHRPQRETFPQICCRRFQ